MNEENRMTEGIDEMVSGAFSGDAAAVAANGSQNSQDLMVSLLQKQLKIQKRIMGVLAALLVVFVIFGAVLIPTTVRTIRSVDATLQIVDETILKVNGEVIPLITELDMDNVNKAVVTMEKAVRELDVESLNGAIEELQKAVEKFDIESLNEAIDNLNTTIQPLKSFVELFGGRN